MRQFLLVSLFAILLADVMLGLGLSLAPGLSVKNAMLYVLFMALILEFVLTDRDPLNETWALHGAWVLLIFYASFTWLAIVLLGLHREYNTVSSFIILKSQLADLFLFLLVYLYAPRDSQKSVHVLQWLVALLVLVNLVTFVDFLNIVDLGVINERSDGRLTGAVREVNQYGAVLVVLIPLTVGLMLGSSGALKLLYAIGAAMAVVLLGLTVSRGSYVGLVVGVMIALYLARHHVRRQAIVKGAILAVVVVAIAGLSVAIVNPEGFLDKFNFAGLDVNNISSGRLDVWRRLLTKMSYWPVSFLTGYGWNAYPVLIGIYGDPHNTYLLYLFNLGVIGFGLYVFIVIWIIRYVIKSLNYISEELKPLVIGFVTGFISVHVAVFFVAIYTPWLFIWALTGTTLRIIVDERRKKAIEAMEGDQHDEVGA